MDKQRGRPVLVEFWDFCRPSSLRTLPYVKAWHERYAARRPAGGDGPLPRLRARRGRGAVRAAVARLEIEHPVCIDLGFELWRAYDNAGWPARYLWNGDGHLAEYHYGEGGYAETELAIQELLGVEREPVGAAAPRGRPDGAHRRPRRPTRPAPTAARTVPARCGRCWAGPASCTSTASGSPCSGPAPTCSSSTAHHVNGVLDLQVGAGVTCYATCFTPGVVLPAA